MHFGATKKCYTSLEELNRNIAIINGPNLNLLGSREKNIYGEQSFDVYLSSLTIKYSSLKFSYYQSNVEGELVSKIQEFGFKCNGIILNAAAYTHTSVAIRDAISAIKCPVIEVHISNIYAREEFRHTSLISPVCKGVICGLGLKGYELGLLALLNKD